MADDDQTQEPTAARAQQRQQSRDAAQQQAAAPAPEPAPAAEPEPAKAAPKLPAAENDPEPDIDAYEDLAQYADDMEAWEKRDAAREALARSQQRRDRRRNAEPEPEPDAAPQSRQAQPPDPQRIFAEEAQRDLVEILGAKAGADVQGRFATLLTNKEIELTPVMLASLDGVLATVPRDGADRVAAVLAHFVDNPASAKALSRAGPAQQAARMERLLLSAAETASAAAPSGRTSLPEDETASGQLRPASGRLRHQNMQRQMQEAAKKGDFTTFERLRDQSSGLTPAV